MLLMQDYELIYQYLKTCCAINMDKIAIDNPPQSVELERNVADEEAIELDNTINNAASFSPIFLFISFHIVLTCSE